MKNIVSKVIKSLKVSYLREKKKKEKISNNKTKHLGFEIGSHDLIYHII